MGGGWWSEKRWVVGTVVAGKRRGSWTWTVIELRASPVLAKFRIVGAWASRAVAPKEHAQHRDRTRNDPTGRLPRNHSTSTSPAAPKAPPNPSRQRVADGSLADGRRETPQLLPNHHVRAAAAAGARRVLDASHSPRSGPIRRASVCARPSPPACACAECTNTCQDRRILTHYPLPLPRYPTLARLGASTVGMHNGLLLCELPSVYPLLCIPPTVSTSAAALRPRQTSTSAPPPLLVCQLCAFYTSVTRRQSTSIAAIRCDPSLNTTLLQDTLFGYRRSIPAPIHIRKSSFLTLQTSSRRCRQSASSISLHPAPRRIAAHPSITQSISHAHFHPPVRCTVLRETFER